MKRTLAIALLLAGCDRWNPDGQARYPNNEHSHVVYYVEGDQGATNSLTWVRRGMRLCKPKCVTVYTGSPCKVKCGWIKGDATAAGERKFGGGIEK